MLTRRRRTGRWGFAGITRFTLGALLMAPAAAAADTASANAPDAERLRQDLHKLIASARDQVFPALVHVHVVSVHYWDGKETKGRSVGSGTIISSDGHVLTNQHVTDNGEKFKLTLADKREVSAELVGEDPLTDLAVLKINLDELEDKGASLTVAKLGDSDATEIGDYVMAMGSPFALSRSVTLGIVSNPKRVFAGGLGADDVEEMELGEGQRTGLFTRWIQHDALIGPGNSGGPLVNLKGEVIGVNELGGAAMGFAIPSNLARTVADALIKHGEVPRSWVGMSFKPIEKTGLNEGVLISSVITDGPAGKAGVRAGDVLLAIDGQPLTVRFVEEIPPLLERLASTPIGTQITLKSSRDNSTSEVTLVTEKLQKDRGDEDAFRAWGINAVEITEKMARDRRLDNADGVLISGIRDGGPAQLAEPALNIGDVVRSIDGKKIADLAGFIRLYDEIMSTKPLPEYLLVEFDRRGQNNLTLVKPKPDKNEDPPPELPKAWVGIATQPVLKKLAEKLGGSDASGFRITRVYPKTEAAKTDLRVGDIIIALNEERMVPRGMQDAGLLARQIRRLDIDDTATLTVRRGGEKRDVKVTLERTRIAPEEARRDQNRDFELTVRELTFFDRDENRWGEDIDGVLVEQAESAGWAGLGGIGPGDLIQRIGSQEIHDLAGYRKVLDEITEAKPERVVFVVLRGTRTHFRYVEPDWGPKADETKQPQDKKE